MTRDLASMAKELAARVQQVAKQHEQADNALIKAAADIARKAPPTLLFKGLMGAYMRVIRDSAGLTSARPASLKAIEAAEKSPTQSSIRLAAEEMRKHIAELERTARSHKAFPDFKKGLESVIRKTEALAG